MRRGMVVALLAALVSLPLPAPAATKTTVYLRGQAQDVYFYPAAGAAHGTILFAPGDGGWRGFALTLAGTLAAWGYDVYGLDTRRYLESFSGKTRLSPAEVMGDFRQLADYLGGRNRDPVILVGWSEGAGLCLLAAASEDNKDRFAGVVTLGLGDENLLGWHWSDYVSVLTRKPPDEPSFRSGDYVSLVAPLPLAMIQSSQDEYVPTAEARRLFGQAQEPKRFALIQAENHRFAGNREELYRVLREAIQWMTPESR